MSSLAHPRVVVIGAGVAGILTGIELRRRGLEDFVILEKADTLGGTWRDNVYPGVACDVPAVLYSFAAEPNREATHRFATGAQLWDYFDRVAQSHGLAPHLRYGVEVTDARRAEGRWTLTTADGEQLVADVVITAVGRLHHPVAPPIDGLDDFAGTVVHSARWDPATELAGRRLGVIGTGSSATQIVSATAGVVGHLSLFQRTAQWVLPMENTPIPRWQRVLIRLSSAYAKRYYRGLEDFVNEIGRAAKGDERAVAARNAAVHAGLAGVRDPELRAKLTPDYEIGCKRLVVSGTFYDAVQHPDVDVVTEPITRVEAQGVRTADGVLHPLDVLVLATGFHADSFLRPMQVTGEDGTDLDALWAQVPLSYKSVALPHMPNFFMINGPFSPGGSASVLAIIETHVAYVMQLLDRIVTEQVAIAPDEQRSVELLEEIRGRASRTVWATGGCQSWYLDQDGVPLVNPLLLEELAADMRTPERADFVVSPS